MKKTRFVSPAGGSVQLDSGLPTRYLVGFGDSRTWQGWDTTYTPPSVASRNALLWAETLSKRVRVVHEYMQAVSGYTCEQLWGLIKNKTPNTYGYTPQMIPASSVCHLLVGINDVMLASSKADIDRGLAFHARIVEYLVRQGHKVIVTCETPPRPGEFSANEVDWMCYMSERMRQYRDDSDVYTVDIWPETTDTTASDCGGLTGLLYDPVHFSVGMAYVLGKKIASVLDRMGLPLLPLTPTSNGDQYDAVNNPLGCLNPNPYVAGTGGNVGSNASGVAPDGYTLAALSAAAPVVGSKVNVTVDGFTRPAWRGVVSAATGGNGRDFYIQSGSLQSLCVPGDVIEAGMEFIVGPGHNNMEAPRIRIFRGDPLLSPISGLHSSQNVTMNANHVETFTGIVRSVRVTISATTTLAVRFGMAVCAPSVTSTVTLDILSCWVRKV